ncbi:MAG: [Fe-Fe] hydrogenase large subunit C-terminal domain-containing protein [archaeon]
MINIELEKIIKIIENNNCVALLAPSFVIDFSYPQIITGLRKIGFKKALELTFAAKLINKKYHNLIKKNPKKQIICANCPSVVKIIENSYPKHKNKIANISSPMVLMGRISKKIFGKNYKTIFIGPCFAKKQEAKDNKKDIDYAITFRELQEILDKKKISLNKIKFKKTEDFDKFYNDYTKIYPLSGAVAKTMHDKELLEKHEVIICDGTTELEKAIKIMEKNKNIKFIDCLLCNGGCIGGNGIISKQSTTKKIKKIKEYLKKSKETKMGKHFGKIKLEEELQLDLKRK